MEYDLVWYTDEDFRFSVRVQEGPDLNNLTPVDLTGASIDADIRHGEELVTNFVVTLTDQSDPDNTGWIDLSLSSTEKSALASRTERLFSYDVRVSLNGEVYFPVRRSSLYIAPGVSDGA